MYWYNNIIKDTVIYLTFNFKNYHQIWRQPEKARKAGRVKFGLSSRPSARFFHPLGFWLPSEWIKISTWRNLSKPEKSYKIQKIYLIYYEKVQIKRLILISWSLSQFICNFWSFQQIHVINNIQLYFNFVTMTKKCQQIHWILENFS